MYIHDIHNICTVHNIIIYGILWWYVRPYTCIYMIYVDICIPSTDNIKHYSPTSARQFIWVARTSVLLVLGFFCDAARSIWGCPNAIPGKQGNMMTYCEIYMTHIYRKMMTMHWNFGYCTPPRPICRDSIARKPCLLSSEANANLWPLRQVHCGCGATTNVASSKS